MNVTESLVFREGGKKRPQSEDLPQVAEQGFRDRGWDSNLNQGTLYVGRYPYFRYSNIFPEVLGDENNVKT